METLLEIKNNYAKEQGYKSWSEIMFLNHRNHIAIENHMNEICIRAQKAVLEKASEKGCDSLELYISEYETLSKAITNPENLIR